MSEYISSNLQDIMDSLESNPIMTVKVTKSPDGTEQIDIVTQKGLEMAGGVSGVHVEATSKEKVAVDIPPQVLAGLEQAFANSPVGNTEQTAALEQLLQQPLTASPAAPVLGQATDQAVVIHPVQSNDPEKPFLYNVQLNPALVNEKVLLQLDALAAEQVLEQQVVDKIKEAIYQERPDLAPQVRGNALMENAAQFDAQGEGMAKIVPTSSGSKERESIGERQIEGMLPVASAQESYLNDGNPFAHANASGSAQISQQTEQGRQVNNASSHGRVIAEAQAIAR